MVETDKVTLEIKAPMSGVIQQFLHGLEDTVDVGADLYILDTDAKGDSAPPKTATEAEPTAAAQPKAAPEPPKATPPPPVTP